MLYPVTWSFEDLEVFLGGGAGEASLLQFPFLLPPNFTNPSTSIPPQPSERMTSLKDRRPVEAEEGSECLVVTGAGLAPEEVMTRRRGSLELRPTDSPCRTEEEEVGAFTWTDSVMDLTE